MDFEFRISESEAYKLIQLKGSLIEKHQADELLDAIDESIEEHKSNFILDLTQLSFLNHSGLEILIGILTRARTHGGDCFINGINPSVLNSETGKSLSGIFTISESDKPTPVFSAHN